jgi:hypothetical protein
LPQVAHDLLLQAVPFQEYALTPELYSYCIIKCGQERLLLKKTHVYVTRIDGRVANAVTVGILLHIVEQLGFLH